MKKIIIVGNPNVGKSVMFNNLTGSYVTVSNYPGTTVEISRGKGKIGPEEFEIIDTPGMYSLLPITEEERIARTILLEERPEMVLHLVDAKNLERMLIFTLQLIEAELPVILVLNMTDEAERVGKKINVRHLEKALQIPVVATVSTTGKGMDVLKKRISGYRIKEHKKIKYGDLAENSIESALENIEGRLKSDYVFSKRAIAILLLKGDKDVENAVSEKDKENFEKIKDIVDQTQKNYGYPLEYVVTMYRQGVVNGIVLRVTEDWARGKISFREKISRWTMNPLTGIPILLLVLYWGLYKFVGEFGSGILVNFLEGKIFGNYLNPFFTKIFTVIIPWKIIQNLFIGDYGVLTLGLRYAVAIILPIVAIFFIAFSIIEDSGYLPRLAMLIDRVFKKVGLSGRAVIPMVLGFGCDTMATMVTRTLPTKRERIIATMLLALAVPCSAQLGVILALLQGRESAMLIWAAILGLVFVFIGYLTAKLLPGEKPTFYMEIPPLRVPKLSNVLIKTYTRMEWYFKEILPLFILASFFIWIGQITRLFDFLINLLNGPVRLIGLPPATAKIFLFGFFRRDYGAAGLYDLNKTGILTGVQLVVACVALTLFLPCIAQFLMNLKERGIKTGIGISVFILFFSFFVAFVVNLILVSIGVIL